ncbi:MAG TPA: DUF5132 domain-containing protein [Bryobacteraceae bacterium]
MKDQQIALLAARIAEQMKPSSVAAPAAPATSYTAPTKSGKSSFFWGAAAAASLFLAAPLFRPVVRQAVKGGLRLGRYAKEVASSAKEELEDITAEAKAEIYSDSIGGNDKT